MFSYVDKPTPRLLSLVFQMQELPSGQADFRARVTIMDLYCAVNPIIHLIIRHKLYMMMNSNN